MELAFKLEAFEGPLDLLLQLIEKNKVSIYDIPIAEITDQYIACVEAMDHRDLDLTSDFLVMAATLLDIKARMLLPKEKTEEEEAEDPRQELVERLLEYKKYRCISEELREYQAEGEQRCFREPDIPREVLNYQEPVNLGELLGDLTAQKLKKIFDEVMRRREDKIDPVRSRFGKITRETVQMSDRIVHVKQMVAGGRRQSFRGLLSRAATRTEVVVTFLAVLELIKTGDIFLTEDSAADAEDIIIEGKESHEHRGSD